jgi:hypothetical protein
MLFEISKSILIIIDNLETVTDERIINFIIDAPEKAKFLITSRKGLGQVERRYELKQLKEKEAVYLFRQLSKDKQIYSLVKLEDNVIKKYVNKVSNYPLAIKWVIGQVARGKTLILSLILLMMPPEIFLSFVLNKFLHFLQKILGRFYLHYVVLKSRQLASLLKYVVELDNKDFDDCVEELILVSLMIPEHFKNEQNEIARKFSILPLTKGYVRQQLGLNLPLRDKIIRRLFEVEIP